VRYRNCHIDRLVTRATLLARYGPVSWSVYMSLSQTEFYRNGWTSRNGFFFIFSIWVWVFIQKARNKRTCNRVKSSEYSNGTKGKINIRTCIWKNASWQSRKHTKTIKIYLNRKRLRIIKEFRYQSFFRAILHCAVKKSGYLQNRGTSLWNFVPNSGLRKFITAHRSSQRVVNLVRQTWTLIYSVIDYRDHRQWNVDYTCNGQLST